MAKKKSEPKVDEITGVPLAGEWSEPDDETGDVTFTPAPEPESEWVEDEDTGDVRWQAK